LGLWAAILLILALTGPETVLALVLLPVLPMALLAGPFLGTLPTSPHDYRLSEVGWTTLVVTFVAVGVALLVGAASAGNNQLPDRFAGAAILALGALLIATWRRISGWGEHLPVLVLVGTGLFAVWTVGSLGRSSFGGSPPGTEPLRAEQTDPRFREAFRELNLMASVSPGLALNVQAQAPWTAWWYGRSISRVTRSDPAGGIVVSEVLAAGGGAPGGGKRLPWRVHSSIRNADLYPLGIARWIVSRQGLMVGTTKDALVLNP
jgi:hypothetical protein